MTFYAKIKNHKNLIVETGWNAKDDFNRLPNHVQNATTENAFISLSKVEVGAIVWHSGTWINGTFYKGIWHTGTWLYGVWEKGSWHNGIWHNGCWCKGIWRDGVWLDGFWESGLWVKGTFIKGKHYNHQPFYGFDSKGNMIL